MLEEVRWISRREEYVTEETYSFGLFVAPRTMTLVSSPDVSPSHSLKETYSVSLRSNAGFQHTRHEFRLHHSCHFMVVRASAPKQRVDFVDKDLYSKRDEPVVTKRAV
jgi:hypothetical protein